MISRNTIMAAIALGASVACDTGEEADAAVAMNAFTAQTEAQAQLPCRVIEAGAQLPEEVRETSGLAQSRRDANVFWTHNDAGNEPVLFAISSSGQLLGRTIVAGANLQDWEDLAAGPCESGNCLYVGDIGDNDAEREEIVIYEITEPSPGAARTESARELRARFPDGARDAESLFVLPNGDLFVVTKGRQGPVAVYRYPSPHRVGQVVTLEHVRELGPEPRDENDRVTGATASPDGRWVGIRSYRTLSIYRADALIGSGNVTPMQIDLQPLREGQGESLVIGNDGSVWLSSEAENKDAQPRWGRMQCTLTQATE